MRQDGSSTLFVGDTLQGTLSELPVDLGLVRTPVLSDFIRFPAQRRVSRMRILTLNPIFDTIAAPLSQLAHLHRYFGHFHDHPPRKVQGINSQ